MDESHSHSRRTGRRLGSSWRTVLWACLAGSLPWAIAAGRAYSAETPYWAPTRDAVWLQETPGYGMGQTDADARRVARQYQDTIFRAEIALVLEDGQRITPPETSPVVPEPIFDRGLFASHGEPLLPEQDVAAGLELVDFQEDFETQQAERPGTLSQAETVGPAPEDYSLEFLRRQTVLLRPCEWQFDFGIAYLIDDDTIPVRLLPSGDVVRLRIRQRLLVVPFAFRLGLTERIQLFTNVPVGWSNTRSAFAGFDQRDDAGGIGDVTAGFSALLCRGYRDCPDVVGTFAFTAPTGNAGLTTTLIDPASTLGDGFWAASVDLLCIHACDPVVVFYGIGARFRFPNTFLGNIHIDPGHQYSYRLGVGYAMNDRITISTAFLGSYIAEDRINGGRVEGGELEPLRLRFAWTIARPCHRIVEPFAEIGMTSDAPDAHVGIVWTY